MNFFFFFDDLFVIKIYKKICTLRYWIRQKRVKCSFKSFLFLPCVFFNFLRELINYPWIGVSVRGFEQMFCMLRTARKCKKWWTWDWLHQHVYEQLLLGQITKAQKKTVKLSVFLRFWDLRMQKLLVECWWNWPRLLSHYLSRKFV